MTNGSGILKLDPNFLEIIRTTQMKYHRPTVMFSINYPGDEFFTIKNPAENEIWNLIKIMGNLKTEIEIKCQPISGTFFFF